MKCKCPVPCFVQSMQTDELMKKHSVTLLRTFISHLSHYFFVIYNSREYIISQLYEYSLEEVCDREFLNLVNFIEK